MYDTTGELYRRYGTWEGLYLIRPDRFVGFTAQPVREAQAVAFLDTLLAREAQEHSTEVRHDVWDPSAG